MNPTCHSHYDSLMVTPNASAREIKRAYRSLCQTFHPDKNPNNPAGANQKFQQINSAYTVLSNPNLRKKHDQWLHTQKLARQKKRVAAKRSVKKTYVRPRPAKRKPQTVVLLTPWKTFYARSQWVCLRLLCIVVLFFPDNIDIPSPVLEKQSIGLQQANNEETVRTEKEIYIEPVYDEQWVRENIF